MRRSGVRLLARIRSSISKRIIASIVVISSLVTVVTTIIQLAFDYHQDVNAIEENLKLIEKSHLDGIAKSVWDLDTMQLNTQVKGVLSLPGVHFVRVSDNHGQVILSEGRETGSEGISVDYSLVFNAADTNHKIGNVHISATLDEVYQKIYQKMFLIFLTQLLKTIVVSTLIYLTIDRLVTRHLVHIAKYVKNLNFGKRSDVLRLKRPERAGSELDELRTLVGAINYMQESLFSSFQEVNALNSQLEEKVKAKTELLILQRQKLEHATKMTALGEIVGGVAHEMNTPLSVVRLRAEMMKSQLSQKRLETQEIEEGLTLIQNTADKISKIIHSLQSFSQDRKYMGLEKAPLEKILDETLDLCRSKISEKGVELKVACPADSLSIDCRSYEISQVLLSLIYNSLDAVEHLSERWIEIRVEETSEEVHLKVIDSGKGIPNEIREKVMQPFFTTKEIGKASGLGLSVSSGIIQAHGGILYLDSSCAHTCFVVRLPKSISQNMAA